MAPESRRDAVVFDVDGTLCDVREIRHFVEAPNGSARFRPNFERFHAASVGCPPHPRVRDLAVAASARGLAVVVVTGRSVAWKKLTAGWLAMHGIPFDELRMRGASDRRPDHVIKAEIERAVSRKYRVLLAVDDRPDILDVWHRARILTVAVAANGELLAPRLPKGTPLEPRVAELLAAAP